MRKYKILPFTFFVVFVVFLQGCANDQHKEQYQSTINLAKVLMDREALKTSVKIFAAKYNTKESKLVTVKEIRSWIRKNKIEVEKFPSVVQKAINDRSTLALLVPRFEPLETKNKTNRLYEGGGIFLPILEPGFGMGGWWISPSGPCDGDFCLNCSGCQGFNCLSGLFETCVCTNSCNNCNECPSCPSNCNNTVE